MNIQQALHALVRDSKHPAKKIAAESGVSYGYLMKAADEMQPEFHLQAKLVAPLTNAAENDVVIQQIAQECGGVFVRLHANDSHDALTAKTVIEFGEYLTRLAEANADGVITRAEVAGLEVEGNDVIVSILAQLKKLKADAQ